MTKTEARGHAPGRHEVKRRNGETSKRRNVEMSKSANSILQTKAHRSRFIARRRRRHASNRSRPMSRSRFVLLTACFIWKFAHPAAAESSSSSRSPTTHSWTSPDPSTIEPGDTRRFQTLAIRRSTFDDGGNDRAARPDAGVLHRHAAPRSSCVSRGSPSPVVNVLHRKVAQASRLCAAFTPPWVHPACWAPNHDQATHRGSSDHHSRDGCATADHSQPDSKERVAT